MLRIDPNSPEPRLWLSALQSEACRGMSVEEREAILLRAPQIGGDLRLELAGAAA